MHVIHLLCRWFMWNVKPYFLWKKKKKKKEREKKSKCCMLQGRCPRILYTKLSHKMAYAKSADWDQTWFTFCHSTKYFKTQAGLGGSVWCAIRLETRRSRVHPPPRSATFFHGDWSWNIFYGHSLPFADSRRAVVSFWRKNAQYWLTA